METKDRGADRVGPAERGAVSMPGARLVTTIVAAERTGGAYSLFEVEVGPGGGEGPHVQHREDECLYVAEGRFAFLVEGAEMQAGPGEHLYVPKGALHSYENVGDASGRLLAIHTPGGTHEAFVGEVGEPATGGAASPAAGGPPERPWYDAHRLAAIGAEYGVEMVGPCP